MALVTMSFCIALMSQPVRMNSVASQSSSSGMRRPFALRAEVLHRLARARCRNTSARSGSPSRAPSADCAGIDQPLGEAETIVRRARAAGRQGGRHARLHLLAGLVVGAANQQDACLAAPGVSSITITVGNAALSFSSVRCSAVEFLPGLADLGRGCVLQEVPAQLQLLERAALAAGLRRARRSTRRAPARRSPARSARAR